jgi:hypothetical protein
MVKLVGGVPPYYTVAIDDNVDILSASETDLFVSYQIQIRVGTERSKTHRVLFGDQAGADEVVSLEREKDEDAEACGTAKRSGLCGVCINCVPCQTGGRARVRRPKW